MSDNERWVKQNLEVWLREARCAGCGLWMPMVAIDIRDAVLFNDGVLNEILGEERAAEAYRPKLLPGPPIYVERAYRRPDGWIEVEGPGMKRQIMCARCGSQLRAHMNRWFLDKQKESGEGHA